MRQLLNWIEHAINFIIALCVSGMTILIFTNVILRYVFHSGITWAEEMSRFMFIWMVFLGSILVLKDESHIGMEILVRRVPEKIRRFLLMIGNIIILFISLVVLIGSWKMTLASIGGKAPATGLPLTLMYGIGIIMSVGMLLIAAMNLFKLWNPNNNKGDLSRKDF